MKIDPAASAAMPTSHGLGARLAGSSALDPFGKRNRNHRQHNSRHRSSNELPHSRDEMILLDFVGDRGSGSLHEHT